MPRPSMTTEEFIRRSKEVHGEAYDYSKVDYKGLDTKVGIICKIHGEFEQTPHGHLRQGCKRCGVEKRSDQRRRSTEDFIKNAKEVHGDTYDYSKVDYKNAHSKVIIICSEHGEFEQDPMNHLRGFGCRKCSLQSRSDKRRSNTEEFIKKAKEVHGDTYDYSNVDYKHGRHDVVIECRLHGLFTQWPSSHLSGRGCPNCGIQKSSDSKRRSTEDFIKKAKEVHGDTYDYSKVDYKNADTKVSIICNTHGEFEQQAGSHLRGSGCRLCADVKLGDSKRFSHEMFIKNARLIHGDTYDYPQEYIDSHTHISIVCKIHGAFMQTPSHHIHSKNGCPSCLYKTAGSIGNLLNQQYECVEREKRFDWLRNSDTDRNFPCDFIIDNKVCVEVDGAQHFRQRQGWAPIDMCQNRDKLKTRLLLENGFHVVRVEQEYFASNPELLSKTLVELIDSLKEEVVSTMHLICSDEDVYTYLR
jgi:very-short-patch-repair endonuclease